MYGSHCVRFHKSSHQIFFTRCTSILYCTVVWGNVFSLFYINIVPHSWCCTVFLMYNVFQYRLLRFKETGLLKRTQWKWLKPAPVCQTQRSYTQVGFEHVQSAFFIMECCAAAALLVVGFEILLVKYRTRILKTVLACKRQPKLKLFLHRQ